LPPAAIGLGPACRPEIEKKMTAGVIRQCNHCFFGLAKTSTAPRFHAIFGAFKLNNHKVPARTRKY
jgi:hypothetical protein